MSRLAPIAPFLLCHATTFDPSRPKGMMIAHIYTYRNYAEAGCFQKAT